MVVHIRRLDRPIFESHGCSNKDGVTHGCSYKDGVTHGCSNENGVTHGCSFKDGVNHGCSYKRDLTEQFLRVMIVHIRTL